MAKNVAITVRVPAMLTIVVHTDEDDANSAIADAMHLASEVNMHQHASVKIERIEPTGNPCYLSECLVDGATHASVPAKSPTATANVFANTYVEGMTQQHALRKLSESSDSRVMVMGFHSKSPEDAHVRFISAPLYDDDAFKVFESIVDSNNYGCVVIVNANSLIKRQRVAERGGWELTINRKNGNQELQSWMPSRAEALSKATDMLQRDSDRSIASVDISNYTNREEGPKVWKTLSTES